MGVQSSGKSKEDNPMNKLRELIKVAGIIAVCSAPMFAQNSVNLAASVPFAFNVGTRSLPAGDYRFYGQAGSPSLNLRTADGAASTIILTTNASRFNPPKQSKLVFRVYGHKRYLAGVWTAGIANGREMSKTAAEKESERAGIPMQVAVLSLGTR
jgi:hypothetical protein